MDRSTYQVTSAGTCYRTEIAAAMKYMTRKDWRSYVLGRSTRGVDATKTEDIIRGWIRTYLAETDVSIGLLEAELRTQSGGSAVATGEQKEEKDKIALLLGRWKQIQQLCKDALASMEGF